jgi:hypothetical protein
MPLFETRVPQPQNFEREKLFCVKREVPVEDRRYEHIPTYEYSHCISQDAAEKIASQHGGQVMKWAGFTPYPEWKPVSIVTDDMIRELCILTTRDDAGRHFTEWSEHYEVLESEGLIAIHRPVHGSTGIDYDLQYWSLELTEKGIALVEANPELHSA